jgi:small nuclear ribonucleoprotein D3
MSVVGNNRVGIPIVVLHDAEGAVIEVETKAGELIRGLLFEAEDQMNLYIKNAIIQDTNGVKRKVNQVYLRGTEIVFIVLPDMLKHAPMFNRYVYCVRKTEKRNACIRSAGQVLFCFCTIWPRVWFVLYFEVYDILDLFARMFFYFFLRRSVDVTIICGPLLAR